MTIPAEANRDREEPKTTIHASLPPSGKHSDEGWPLSSADFDLVSVGTSVAGSETVRDATTLPTIVSHIRECEELILKDNGGRVQRREPTES